MKRLLFIGLITISILHFPHAIISGQHSAKLRRKAAPSKHIVPRNFKRPSEEELDAVASKCKRGILHGLNLAGGIPEYPEEAKKEHASGTVIVQIYINERGRVYYAKATSGPASLQRTPVEVAYRARFKPFMSEGKPLRCTGVLDYKFVWP